VNTPLSAGGSGSLVGGATLLMRGATLLVRGMTVLRGVLFVVGPAGADLQLTIRAGLAPVDPMTPPGVDPLSAFGDDPMMARGGEPMIALGGDPMKFRDAGPSGDLLNDQRFVDHGGSLDARRTVPRARLVRGATLAPVEPMTAPDGEPPGEFVNGVPTTAPPGAPPGSPVMADPTMALEDAPPDAGPACSCAGSPGAPATVNTIAPSKISLLRAGRCLAVKNNNPLFMQ
jgi:hypothetical protein